MKVLCCIPARGGSKRLPGKNIIKILGKPMITYAIGHAKAAKLVDEIVVATDDDGIAEVASAEGVRIVRRPPEISGDTACIEDSLRLTVRVLEEEDGYHPDITIFSQANIIYRPPGLIDQAVQKLIDNEHLTAVVTCYEINQRPEWMKRIEGDLLVPNMECDKFRQQDLPMLYLADGAAVVVRTEVLMKTEGQSGVHLFCGDAVGYVIQDRMYAVDVDHPEDVLAAEVLLTMIQKKDISEQS